MGFLMTLSIVSLIDFAISHQIVKFEQGTRARKLWLVTGVIVNVSLLVYFKYLNFFVDEINAFAKIWIAKDFINWIKIVMPIGVSFVVFEEISYLIDVYRGRSKPAKNFATYALFLFLFPHSIAGPIFRWHDLENQLNSRTHTVDKISAGFVRFLLGLGKKVLIADQVAFAADILFAQDPSTLPWSYAWVGMIAYTLQIYYDFSGYSDMAIGIGSILGFQFKENFNFPYSASSITDFWRRWHISLSSWMRDYLYIPLGGNRGNTFRTYFNLVLVFLISGFWHGANWTFLAWGGYHGLLLLCDRVVWEEKVARYLPSWINNLLTLFLVMIGWVLFRAESLSGSLIYMSRLFAFGDIEAYRKTSVSWGEIASNRALTFGIFGIVLCAIANFKSCNLFLIKLMRSAPAPQKEQPFILTAQYMSILIVFALVTLSLVSSNFSPFIYFRF